MAAYNMFFISMNFHCNVLFCMLLYCDIYILLINFYQKIRLNYFKAAVFSSDSTWYALQQTRFPSYPSPEASRITSTTTIDSWSNTNVKCHKKSPRNVIITQNVINFLTKNVSTQNVLTLKVLSAGGKVVNN